MIAPAGFRISNQLLNNYKAKILKIVVHPAIQRKQTTAKPELEKKKKN